MDRPRFGSTLVAEFGPADLKAVREAMVQAGLCRNVVNARTNRVRRMFKWSVESQLVEPIVLQGLQAVAPLKKGRSAARDTNSVKPVPKAHVDEVLKHVTRPVKAMIECILSDRSAGSFTAMLAQPDGEQSAPGRFFVWASDRTTIAVVVDGTIYPGDSNRSYLRADDDSGPIENSSDVLAALSREYNILYLTARPHLASASTREWLDAHGFPSGPLATARDWRIYFRQERFKRQNLARLRRHVPNLLIGIGDKQLDARAYADNRMLAIQIGGATGAPVGLRTVGLRDWEEIRRFFEVNRSMLSAPDRLRRLLQGDTVSD